MYQYQPDVVPELPPDYVVPENATEVQLLEQTIHNQEKIIEFLFYQLNEQETNDQLQSNENQLVVSKLDELIEQGQTGDSTLVDSNGQMLQKLDSLNQSVQVLNESAQVGSNTVLTYGVLYIPLAIIIFLLYKFFWSFLRPLR